MSQWTTIDISTEAALALASFETADPARQPVTPESAERLRAALSCWSRQVVVQLRLSETATARAQAVVEGMKVAAADLQRRARLLSGIDRQNRTTADPERARLAGRCRELSRLALLVNLKADGLRADLDRARRIALEHRDRLDELFLGLDGRPAGHEFGLRLRLIVRGAFASDGMLTAARANLIDRLGAATSAGWETAVRLSALRCVIDARAADVREHEAEVAAGCREMHAQLALTAGRPRV